MSRSVYVVALVLSVFAASVSAAPLGLTENPPIAMASYVNLMYDPLLGDVGSLSAASDSFATIMSLDDVDVSPGVYVLTAEIVPSTGEALSGYLKVTGDTDGNGIAEVLYYSTNLVAFGYFGTYTGLLEFQFIQEEAPLGAPEVNLQAPVGSPIGAYVSFFSFDFDGEAEAPFAVPFFDDISAYGKAFTPEPGSLMLLTLGGLSLLRRRSGKQ